MTSDETPVGVAVLGLGNVGSAVVRIIEESASDLTARIGAPLVLRGVGVRRVAADRGVPVEMLTDNIDELVSRDDVVLEHAPQDRAKDRPVLQIVRARCNTQKEGRASARPRWAG